MTAIISLLVIVTLSILITRIASVALTHTGLSKESARFQARSAFTGVGFTTNESETVVNQPVRRKIILLLMLLGNAGFVSSMSSLVLIFISTNEKTSFYLRLGILLAGLLILWIAAYSKWIDKHLSYLIEAFLNRYTKIDVKDYGSLLHLSDNYRVSEIKITQNHWLADKTLAEMNLRQEGILVLGIQRKEGKYVGAPKGRTKIFPEDTLILYGRAALLEEFENRQKGSSGDQEHKEAVAEQGKILEAEKEKD